MAVKEFQRVFDLSPDGIVGPATWYRILYIYSGIKRLSELNSEGLTLGEISTQYPSLLQDMKELSIFSGPVPQDERYLHLL